MKWKRNEYYKGKTGCLNCDEIQYFIIKKGTETINYLDDIHPQCKKCGCRTTIKMYAEYKATKEAIKDILIHGVMGEQHEEGEKVEKVHAHYK